MIAQIIKCLYCVLFARDIICTNIEIDSRIKTYTEIVRVFFFFIAALFQQPHSLKKETF